MSLQSFDLPEPNVDHSSVILFSLSSCPLLASVTLAVQLRCSNKDTPRKFISDKESSPYLPILDVVVRDYRCCVSPTSMQLIFEPNAVSRRVCLPSRRS